MNGARNADESLRWFRDAHANYNRYFRKRVEEIRTRYSDNPTGRVPSAADNSLEAHVREYLVNHLLDALNWRLGTTPEQDLPEMVPEAPISSVAEGTTRYLDYLGMDSESKPLLVVETKRPSTTLPRKKRVSVDDPLESSKALICAGLGGADIGSEWNKWLETMGDYVRSIKQRFGEMPRRAVITNGDWMVVYNNPEDAFAADGTRDPEQVFVYENREDQEERYAEVFSLLEYRNVLGEAPALREGEVAFHLAPDAITGAMHGLRLLYIEDPGFFEPSPAIKVMPVIFLRSRFGAWLRVDSEVQRSLPDEPAKLLEHLADIRNVSATLLARLNERLGTNLDSMPLTDHYADEESFKTLLGVEENVCRESDRCTEFLVATGDNTHYLLPQPTVPGCPYHDWAYSNAAGQGTDLGPIVARKIEPRSFFKSGEIHHCAHKQVAVAKANRITAANRDRTGPRSGDNEQAFCEIWPFEEHLCCRTCAFELVCTKAEVFTLPCQRPDMNDAP